ncbi:MAG: hypothetical protein KDB60_15195 [Propionibacteriaceae bacterium]|nr:hypothetical protein [Propionibacteriaceae bacterium]
MEFLIGVFVVLHLLGMAAIVGGWLAMRLGAPRGLVPLVWGARAQVVIGLVLVALNELNQEDVNNIKIGVKLLVALAVAACAEIARARAKKGVDQPALVNAAFALTLVNVLVAVLWQSAS